MEMFNPCHPGELLREYMGDLTVTALAKHLGMSRANLSMILNKRAGVSALTSLKLDEAFGTSNAFWLRAQMQYELWHAKRRKRGKIRVLPQVKMRPRPTKKEFKEAA